MIEVFDAEARSRSVARFEVESELRRALERGELCLYYQPVVDLTGRLEKVEALVRWSHPSGRVVLPGEFVPLAEASGLIVQLGDMVLHMACDQVNRWRREYPALADLGVAVNISSAQLRSEDAVHNMASIIEGTGLPLSALILELTESVLMDERTGAVSKLTALRSYGRAPGGGRLRDGLLVAVVPAALPPRHVEDRPQLRRRPGGQPRGRHHRRCRGDGLGTPSACRP